MPKAFSRFCQLRVTVVFGTKEDAIILLSAQITYRKMEKNGPRVNFPVMDAKQPFRRGSFRLQATLQLLLITWIIATSLIKRRQRETTEVKVLIVPVSPSAKTNIDIITPITHLWSVDNVREVRRTRPSLPFRKPTY